MKLRIFSLFLLLVATSTFAAASTPFCACCAEPGTYSVSTGKMAQYEIDLLKDMKFGAMAELYTDARGFEDMKGLAEVIKEFETETQTDFNIVDAFTGSKWTLTFKTGGGKVGTLVLPRPIKMTSRSVDIPDKLSTPSNVVLYKEWIFNGNVSSGTGFFRRDVAGLTKFTLIFQGHGNNCPNAEDFTNWRLQITGPKADYAFFGKMKSAG